MAVNVDLDDIDIDYSGLPTTASPLSENEARQVVLDRYFQGDDREKRFQEDFSKIVVMLVPEQYRSEENIRQINLLPFWRQLLSYNDAVNINAGERPGTSSIETNTYLFPSDEIKRLEQAEASMYYDAIKSTLQFRFPNVNETDILKFAQGKLDEMRTGSDTSVAPALEVIEMGDVGLSQLDQEFVQYAQTQNITVTPPATAPAATTAPTVAPTTTAPTGQIIPPTVGTPPQGATTAGSRPAPTGAVVTPGSATDPTDPNFDVEQAAQASVAIPVETFDWGQFDSDDVRWIIRSNSNLDQAFNQLYTMAENAVGLIEAGELVVAPGDRAPTIGSILNYSAFDVLDPTTLGFVRDADREKLPSDGNLPLSELRKIPYYLTTNGVAEISRKLHYAGYYDRVGERPMMEGDPADPAFNSAYQMMLRDTIARDTTMAESLYAQAEQRMRQADETLRAQRPSDTLRLNNLGREILGRDLYRQEIDQVLALVNSFTEEEKADFLSTGQRPEQLEVAGLRAIQQVAGEELDMMREGRAFAEMAGFSFDRYFGGGQFNEPRI